ncbi:iron-sulfur cluster assembly 1 homolog, mitochondrial isoform X7 [Canis lupus dingo]|uniref:iron-sulfur cluster assembly 1 homolog, mitochondrial isoform X7 n=1 Tax=Canis lupus dingo TaxID=286419 RepID=UPI0020C32263|nr:iron-sulfur cluster assembly 1 homolog, mitochondrial isoform X7 [Canis lupus dingo]
MKVSNKDFLELQCRTVLSDGIKRLLSRTVPLFGFYLWESGSFLLGFHPIGQVLLPPPSKPESSRDLPWSLHQVFARRKPGQVVQPKLLSSSIIKGGDGTVLFRKKYKKLLSGTR